MRLYQGTVEQFAEDTRENRIADKLRDTFEAYYSHHVSPSELKSWNNSLHFLKDAVVDGAGLHGNMLAIECELPYSTRRIDCLIFGEGEDGGENVVVVELKQWDSVRNCEIDENVLTVVGGDERMVPHPLYQVRGYHNYLKDFIQVFDERPKLDLSSCAYCHNYSRKADSVLFLPKFEKIVEEFPLFTKDDFKEFSNYLKKRLGKGGGLEIFNRFKTSNIRPYDILPRLKSGVSYAASVF